ncbi:MAG TPA: histidine phosphatase family protein, partial [Anaerolineales bacterium]|nr:histidine phosphatase family protein [Anaerolineales bacterium]
LAHELSGMRFERIFSSPVMRAVQTARILAESLQSPLEISEALREWSVGIYEGTTDPAGWDLHRQVQEDWFHHQKFDSKMPGGENFHEIRARFVPLIDKLVQQGKGTDQNYLLVAHGGLYLAMLPVIFKNIPVEFAIQYNIPHTTCSIAETRPDGLYCISWFGNPMNDG